MLLTGTLFYWGYGIEAKAQMENEELKKVPDNIEIEGGKCLNVEMREQLPRCHWYSLLRYRKRNCPLSGSVK